MFLALVGVVVSGRRLQLSNNRTGVDPLGPKPVPVFVGSLLIVLAVALASRSQRQPRRGRGWRGHRPRASQSTSRRCCCCRGFRRQHRADRLPWLGDQRRAAVLRFGHRLGQPALHPGPGDQPPRCPWAPSTASPSGSASPCRPASCKGSCDAELPVPARRICDRGHADQPAAGSDRGHRSARRSACCPASVRR